MAAKPEASAEMDRQSGADTPAGFVDYVVRFRKAGLLMRTQLYRVRTEAEAVDKATEAVQTGSWQGWTIMDVSTVEESIARYRGVR